MAKKVFRVGNGQSNIVALKRMSCYLGHNNISKFVGSPFSTSLPYSCTYDGIVHMFMSNITPIIQRGSPRGCLRLIIGGNSLGSLGT